jgi:glutamyl-tRNA reductase
MLDDLSVIHFPIEENDKEITLLRTVQKHFDALESKPFTLKTCQRFIYISLNEVNTTKLTANLNLISDAPVKLLFGLEAYQFLLKIICGLKSKLQAEHEIVHQFKLSYLEFNQQSNKEKFIIKLLEKLLKDSKKIRTKFLQGIGQKTYAGLVRKILLKNYQAKTVVILGSGTLALDIINQLKNKVKIVLCARNEQKVKLLANEHKLNTIDWEQRYKITSFNFIINTIGTTQVLYDATFYNQWDNDIKNNKKLLIDFGAPSPICPKIKHLKDIYMLDKIYEHGETINTNNVKQIDNALSYINKLSISKNINKNLDNQYNNIQNHLYETHNTTPVYL